MHLLVTGARGQLGMDVVAAGRREGHTVVGLDRSGCDITVAGAAAASIHQYAPDVVINCAAWTRVDDAESEPEAARRVNVMGPRMLAAACHTAGVLLCHVSTDFVFDGSANSPMDERTKPAPLNVYGASKLAGEEEVRRLCPRHQVIRTGWLFGGAGPNFVLTILRLAGERGKVRVVNDQKGSPTWTGHLSLAMLRLAERGCVGTYHLSASGETTWYGFAKHILRAAGLTHVEVEAISSAQYPTAARRPRYSVLDNRAWCLLGEEPLARWEEGLSQYLTQRASRGDG